MRILAKLRPALRAAVFAVPLATAIAAPPAAQTTPQTAVAQPVCGGVNVLDGMSATERADLRIRTDAAPYAQGNFWTARRGGKTLHLVGTYHLDDPRHENTMAALTTLIDAAAVVLVEAGPAEEKALMQRMAENPDLITITEGPTMIEQLSPAEWETLSAALRDRKIPPFMGAKFRPWYLTVVLAIPSCKMPGAGAARGLDGRVIAAATAAHRPVEALEPYDTVFSIFDEMTAAEELTLFRSTLATLDRSEDYSKTLADAYFAGDSRIAWELMRDVTLQEAGDVPGYTPEQALADFDRMEEVMMSRRNRAWIPVIEAAAERGPVVAAFGALHLSGEEGVLNLLAKNGWTLEQQRF